MKEVNCAPGQHAYTPAAWEVKRIIEDILSAYEYGESLDDIHTTIFLNRDNLVRNLKIMLGQDILYKIGIPYDRNLEW